jgi:hypothetical protein
MQFQIDIFTANNAASTSEIFTVVVMWMTGTLPRLVLKFLFGDTHRRTVTHGCHNVKLISHLGEKQNKVMAVILMVTLDTISLARTRTS